MYPHTHVDMAICASSCCSALRLPTVSWSTIRLLILFLFSRTQATRLYSSEDPVTILTSDTVKESLHNSSSAWLVQFYSSWCGHCIQYSPTWKALAGDVKDWEPAIHVGVLDCAHEKNFDICREFGIHFYPTFRYFKARGSTFDVGKTYRGPDRELQTVRQLMVNFLQNHTREDWPVGCPPLEPTRSESILSLLGQKSDQYTAVIIEDEDSFVGREVILDLMVYEGLRVTRALSSDKALLEKLGVTAVPAAYLLHPNGSHSLVDTQKRLRFFFSSFLKLLPGVHRKQAKSGNDPVHAGPGAAEVWKEFDKSKVYMVDLESGLHYLLRVELASHQTLEGEELKTFKDFVTVVAKLFPGRPSVVKLLETLLEWLVSLPLERIPYNAILDLVNNKMRISGLFLSSQLQWVGCQGSLPGLRGYPCSLWTLFHTLTVQAAQRPDALANTGLEEDPLAVLQTMRRYIGTFFGCQECGRNLEAMAKESLSQVQSLDQAVLWLWRKHNQVNNRLAGTLSEDPRFPKTQWPTPDLCPACHEERDGLHVWNEEHVLFFLKRHYASANISPKYTSSVSPEPGPPGDQAPAPASARDQTRLGEALSPKAPAAQERRPRPQGRTGEAGVSGAKETRPGGVSFLGLGFSSVDMSLCVLLYASSCLFLMLMFFFFRMRSKRWKVRYSRPYV
ncbi:sulfhydryl oxidase 2 [Conger conger]|uniref:sulfhydryl oxidase 2 n=1 Tax=Conger conger TaxID=82655 RepID=UPI002A5B0286|nr:sulfhydryl oxidase 2 [Conger conger]